jgi:hypothetical protein
MQFRYALKQDCEGSLLEGRYVMNLWAQVGKMNQFPSKIVLFSHNSPSHWMVKMTGNKLFMRVA